MTEPVESESIDPQIHLEVVGLYASFAAFLEGELFRWVEASPPGGAPDDLAWERVLEARWQALGGLLVDHAQPLRDGLRRLAGLDERGPRSEDAMPCPSATPSWYALEAQGLRETFLLAAASTAERQRLERWVRDLFERLLERQGFAADHASAIGALLAAAGRDLAFLACLLQAAADEELAQAGEPAVGRSQRTRVRQATRTLARLSGNLERLAASFESEDSAEGSAHCDESGMESVVEPTRRER